MNRSVPDDARHVVVIGSGPSGAIAALGLLRQGIPVTMLESGITFPGGVLIRMMGRNVFRRRPPLDSGEAGRFSPESDSVWFRALVPGGLSNFWTGAVPRFAPEDFREGERLHEKYRWPVSYEDLAPYYRYVEEFMGVAGSPRDVPNLPAATVGRPLQLPEEWREVAAGAETMGQGFVPLPMADVAPWLVTRSGAAFNTFTRILPLLHAFRNFRLILGAHALRVEWDGTKRRAAGVTFYDRQTGTVQRIDGVAVVVAAGPIASTKLLLDSTSSDFPDGLGNTEGILGRYLHDHPKDWFVVELDKALPRLGHAAYLTRAPYVESPPLAGAQSVIGNSSGSVWTKALTFAPLPSRTFGVLTFSTMIPSPDNCVGLRPESKDEFGLPAIDLRIRYGEEVPGIVAGARERLLAVLHAAGYEASIRTPPADLVPGTSVHYAGSVRMHDAPRWGVLNRWNRIHGVENVVVADASCFTTAVEKNPLLTSMALSARAVDKLADDLRTGALRRAGTPSVIATAR